jgi:hypothetical protein
MNTYTRKPGIDWLDHICTHKFTNKHSAEVQAAEKYLQAAIDDALASSPPPSPSGGHKRRRPQRHGAVIVNPANNEVKM